MSTTITLNAKAYTWAGYNPQQFGSWRNTASGVPSDFSYLTGAVTMGGAKTSSHVKWNLAVPHIATAATSCSCPGGLLGTDRVRIHVELYPGSTDTERADILARIRSLVLTTDFANSITTFTTPSSA